jgi:hypothetical protein
MIKSFSKYGFARTSAKVIAFLILRKSFSMSYVQKKRTILLQKIMNWFDHERKIMNKLANKINNAHESSNFFLGSGGNNV